MRSAIIGGVRRANVAPVDPYAAYVKMLLRMEGANLSTTFTDEKGRTIINAGAPFITTAETPPCGDFKSAATTKGIYMANDPTFAFGTQDFCVEMYVKTLGVGSNYGFLFANNTSSSGYGNACVFFINHTGKLAVYHWDSGYVMEANGSGSVNLVTGNWAHVAITRYLNKMHAFVDGVEQPYTTQLDISAKNLFGAAGWSLARDQTDSSYDTHIGLVDDYRITVGVPRYTGNFTPPVRGSI